MYKESSYHSKGFLYIALEKGMRCRAKPHELLFCLYRNLENHVTSLNLGMINSRGSFEFIQGKKIKWSKSVKNFKKFPGARKIFLKKIETKILYRDFKILDPGGIY